MLLSCSQELFPLNQLILSTMSIWINIFFFKFVLNIFRFLIWVEYFFLRIRKCASHWNYSPERVLCTKCLRISSNCKIRLISNPKETHLNYKNCNNHYCISFVFNHYFLLRNQCQFYTWVSIFVELYV